MRGERFLLVQAVTNLLQNAVEFSPEGGAVLVRLEQSGELAQVVIEDNGRWQPEKSARTTVNACHKFHPRQGCREK